MPSAPAALLKGEVSRCLARAFGTPPVCLALPHAPSFSLPEMHLTHPRTLHLLRRERQLALQHSMQSCLLQEAFLTSQG